MNLNYIDLFDRAVATSRNHLAVADDDRQLTYAELQAFTSKIARALHGHGFPPSTPVGILSPNTVPAMAVLLSTLRAGGAWCNINLRNALPINIDVLTRGRCEIVFFDSSQAASMAHVKAEVPTLRHLVCLDRAVEGFPSLAQFCEGATDETINVRLGHDQVGMQGTTGGTTGKAKVVRHGPGFLAMNAIGFMIAFGTIERPVNLAVAPITHAGGVVAMGVLALGGTVHLMHHPDQDELLTKLEKFKVSLLFLPPTLIYVLMNHPRTPKTDFSSLRLLMSAAAPFNVEKIAAAQRVFGPVIGQSYGQTETGFPLTYMSPAAMSEALANPKLAHRLASCGTITANMGALAAIDEEGNVCPPGQVGELAGQGPTIMIEYVDDPEATAALRVGPWQRTGDVGYVDEDGFVYISDRKRDLIITGGFNVFPLQVEQVLAGHAAVQDSAVIGVPDDKWGEAVKAVVELAPGKTVSEEELIAFCKDALGSVMAPKSIDFIETLPRSAVGKVLKRDLREKYWTGRKQRI